MRFCFDPSLGKATGWLDGVLALRLRPVERFIELAPKFGVVVRFPKDDLATEAFTQALALSREAFRGEGTRRKRSVPGYLDYLLSSIKRDKPCMSCPMTASASEIGRHGKDISARFVKGFQEKASAFEAVMDEAIPAAERRRLGGAIVAVEIGAMAAARAVAKSAPSLSDEILKAVHATLVKASKGSKAAALLSAWSKCSPASSQSAKTDLSLPERPNASHYAS